MNKFTKIREIIHEVCGVIEFLIVRVTIIALAAAAAYALISKHL